jgi:hypothetical protein
LRSLVKAQEATGKAHVTLQVRVIVRVSFRVSVDSNLGDIGLLEGQNGKLGLGLVLGLRLN